MPAELAAPTMGPVTIVVGHPGAIGGALARRLGADSVLLDAAASGNDEAMGLREAFAAAAAGRGVASVVHAHLPAASLRRRPLGDLDGDDWDELVDGPVRALLATLQAARSVLDRGGRIVVVVPSVGVLGEPGLVAACTAAEAARGLAKSAARAWGPGGIAVHLVAGAPSAFGSEETGSADANVSALADTGADGVAEAVHAALVGLPGSMTGTTLFVDGGRTMLP